MRTARLLIRPREDWGEGCEAWDPRIKRHVCLNRGRRKRSRRSAEERRAVEEDRERSGGDTVQKADEYIDA